MKRDYKNKFQEFKAYVVGILAMGMGKKNGSNGKITQKLDKML